MFLIFQGNILGTLLKSAAPDPLLLIRYSLPAAPLRFCTVLQLDKACSPCSHPVPLAGDEQHIKPRPNACIYTTLCASSTTHVSVS